MKKNIFAGSLFFVIMSLLVFVPAGTAGSSNVEQLSWEGPDSAVDSTASNEDELLELLDGDNVNDISDSNNDGVKVVGLDTDITLTEDLQVKEPGLKLVSESSTRRTIDVASGTVDIQASGAIIKGLRIQVGSEGAGTTVTAQDTRIDNVIYTGSSGVGVKVDEADTHITGATFENFDTAVKVTAGASTSSVRDSNFIDNGYGVDNTTTGNFTATQNFWGHISGPSKGEGALGRGDMVSDHVDYDPWLMRKDGVPTIQTYTESFYEGELLLEIQAIEAETSVGAERVETTLTLAEYTDNPRDVDPGLVGEKNYLDVNLVAEDLPNALNMAAACPGGDCSHKVLRWFDGTSWKKVKPQQVVNGGIEATLDGNSSPKISELDGTPFVIGTLKQPPDARFTYIPAEPKVQKEVTFDASDSTDRYGEITGYRWHFGDGDTATGEKVTNTYPEKGKYTVKLIVTDNEGMKSTASTELDVTYEREYVQVESDGWSLVSAPLKPEYRRPTEVFKGVNKSTIYHYDAGKGGYVTPSEGYEVSALHGTWIRLTEEDVPKVFTIPGVYSGNVTIELTDPGWHQVGSPLKYGWSDIGVKKGEEGETMTVFQQSNGPSAPHWMSRFIWDWSAADDSYTAYDASRGNPDFDLKPGKAYWVKTYEPNVKLVVPYAAPPPVPTESSRSPRGIPLDSSRAEELNLQSPPAPPKNLTGKDFSLRVKPNPLMGGNPVTFLVGGPEVRSFELEVYNPSGKLIHVSEKNRKHSYTWEPETDLSNGLYLYQATARKGDGETLTETGKLLVLK